MDDAAGEGGALETGHGGRIAGEHAGVVGDGCLPGEGTAHAGGRLFRQLETGRQDLARQQDQGDEGGLDGRLHCFSSG
ncbi:hypothetical protein D3C76_772480 [compost metagenome]